MATVLLVERDPLQASLRKSALARRFSDVERVSDAAEALCLVEQPQISARLGLVICTHDTLGFGSRDFVEELHARLPNLPVLVLGGSSQEAKQYSGDRVRFLVRPFEGEKLLAAASQMAPLTALKLA